MRIALCYHGIAKGTNFKSGGLPVGYAREFELLTKNLIAENKDHKFDIYMHSWSQEYEEEVVDRMKPKNHLFEPSREFKKPTPFLLLKESIKKLFGKTYEFKRINNIYSRWYSFYKVCQLVKESNIIYDLVIVTRFDMCLFKPFSLNQVDKNAFYSGDWITYYLENTELQEPEYRKNNKKFLEIRKKGYPYDDEGLQDFFFISSYDYMLNKFCEIYNELEKLIKKYGKSNHLIALGKLKEDNYLEKHDRILVYNEDYFLSRWL